jgi:hypothetical protein
LNAEELLIFKREIDPFWRRKRRKDDAIEHQLETRSRIGRPIGREPSIRRMIARFQIEN